MYFNSLFDDVFNDFFNSSLMLSPKTNRLMSTDVKEKEGAYELDIDMPGYSKEDVKAELKDGYLTISASKSSNNDEAEEGKYLRRERYYGNLSRSFYVGEDLKNEDIKAKFENGILKLMVPKKEPVVEQPQYIAIEG